MTGQYLPKDIGEWMRTQEKRVSALTRRRIQSDAWAGSPFTKNLPRWQTRLSANATVTQNVMTYLAFNSSYSAPFHNPPFSNGTDPNAFLMLESGGIGPRYVALTAGFYSIQAGVYWTGAASGGRKLNIYVGTDPTPAFSSELMNAGAGVGIYQQVAGFLPLAEGEYFRVAAYQGGTGAVVINATGSSSGSAYAASKLNVVPMGAYDYTAP